MIYVYRSVNSTGARDLANALDGMRVKQAPVRLRAEDVLVCWGSHAPGLVGRRSLNNVPLQNKYEDALTLQRANVPTIAVSLRRPDPRREPAPRPANPPVAANRPGNIRGLFQAALDQANEFVENENPNFNSPVFVRGVNEFRTALDNLVRGLEGRVERVPAPARPVLPVPAEEWLGRRFNHVGGKDLLRPGLPAQYFSKKEDLVEEFRIHSFSGQSIRAGKKVHREDFVGRIHPWVRSWDGGWKMSYEGVRGTPELRDLAHRAVAALDLDFGAVDIGRKRDGSLIVLEVNRAPGIEGGTVVKYKEAIERWMAGGR